MAPFLNLPLAAPEALHSTSWMKAPSPEFSRERMKTHNLKAAVVSNIMVDVAQPAIHMTTHLRQQARIMRAHIPQNLRIDVQSKHARSRACKLTHDGNPESDLISTIKKAEGYTPSRDKAYARSISLGYNECSAGIDTTSSWIRRDYL